MAESLPPSAFRFESMDLWLDPQARPGPEAMAVDEWLLEHAERPTLRVYDWQGEWGSLGYFGPFEQARIGLPGLRWVRRWTGGGTVDHRADWTYTLVAPAGSALAKARAAASFHFLHTALACCLQAEGREAKLSSGADATGAALCFQNPVAHDLIDPATGLKLAGAGQRRTRLGLLHQGSVALPLEPPASARRARTLAGLLAAEVRERDFQPDPADLAGRIERRYRPLGEQDAAPGLIAMPPP